MRAGVSTAKVRFPAKRQTCRVIQESRIVGCDKVNRQRQAQRDLKACHCCGLIHWVPLLDRGQLAVCVRCQATIQRQGGGARASNRTAAAACGAFFLFWPAILLPIVEVERLGHRHQSSLLMGTLDLLAHREWFVGTIVLLFSIVFPLVKIGLLLELSLLGTMHHTHKAITYRIMESAGKWSMMDVMLLAFLVMLVKLGSLIEFHFGPAVVAFVLCVGMNMLASWFYDPHSIWQE